MRMERQDTRLIRPVLVFFTVTLLVPFAARHAAGAPPEEAERRLHPHRRHGRGDVAAYGGNQGKTPNIDRLAAEGTKFMQFYVASPICSPSRAAFTTGVFPGRLLINNYLHSRAGNRASDQANWLDPKWPTLARTLKSAGYATAHFGKWHMGGGRDVQDAPTPADYGFDEFHVNCEGDGPRFEDFGDAKTPTRNTLDGKKYFRYEFTEYWVDRGIDFIRRRQSGPFYLELWPQDVHTPHTPSQAALARTATAGLPKDQHNFRAVLNEYDRQIGRFLNALTRNGPGKEYHRRVLGGQRPGAVLQACPHARPARHEMEPLRGRDPRAFLRALARQSPRRQSERDHGAGQRGLFRHDLRLVGVKPPGDAVLDGSDMSRVWLGGAGPRSKPLFWEYGRTSHDYIYPRPDPNDKSPNVAVRDGNWKLLINADSTRAELYDLAVDPQETKNRAAEMPGETARLLRPGPEMAARPAPPCRSARAR